MTEASRNRTLLLFGGLFLVTLFSGCGGSGSDAPNILLVTVDTLRADRLHCYGYSFPVSPVVDALAADGTLYTQCTAHSSFTIPSLSSLMSGLYPSEVGAVRNTSAMPESVETLAEALQARGYNTAAFVSNFNLRPSMQFNAGFDHYDARFTEPERNRPHIRTRNAKHTSDAVMGWLATRDRNDERPFFIWIHYQDPHGPYTPPQRFVRSMDDYPKKKLPVLNNNFAPHGIPKYQLIDGRSEAAFYRSLYDGEVLFFDGHFGRLVEFMKERGLYEPTAIVFTSDHGESMGEHGYWFCHGQDLYSELVSVPLIMKLPGKAPVELPGKETGKTQFELPGEKTGKAPDNSVAHSTHMTHVGHMDIYPTLMALAGAPARELKRFRGRNLLDPSFTAQPDRPVYTETRREVMNDWLRSVRVGTWKLITEDGKDAKPMLFDLASDPGETRDLFADEPRIAEQLLQALVRERKRALSGLSASDVELSPEERKNLEALGYGGN